MTFIIYAGGSKAWQGGHIKNPPFRKGDSWGGGQSSPLLLERFFFVLKQVNIPLRIGDIDACFIEALFDRFG
jgi:hypothetical protein